MFPITLGGEYRMKNRPSSNPFKKLDTQYSRGINYWSRDVDMKCIIADKYIDGGTKSTSLRRLQIANPFTGQTHTFQIDHAVDIIGKRIGEVINGDLLNLPPLAGCKLQITGANNLSGKSFHPNVMKLGETKLLVKAGDFGFQKWRRHRDGERRRIRTMGCFLDRTVAAISLKLVEPPLNPIYGLTNNPKSKTLGPKRASKIRKLFNLSKMDDVRKFVIKRNVEICKKSDKKGVKIQRLITPERIRRKKVQLQERMKRSLRRSMERKEFERKYKK